MPRLAHLRSLAAGLSLGMAAATASATDPFIAKYLATEKTLLDRYVHNRKATARAKSYKLGKANTSVLLGSSESTAIFGENAFRNKGRRDYQSKKGQWVTGQLTGGLRIPGDGYSLAQGDTPNSYRIASQVSPQFLSSEFGSLPPGPFIYPLMYGGDDGGPYTLGYVLRHAGQTLPNTKTQQTFLSANPTTWQGRPAIAVKIRSTFDDVVSTTYVDPTNDYAALGYDSDGSYDPITRKKGTVRRMGVLTYAPSAEGIPLPAKYEMWFVLPDGRKLPNGVIEFLEYSRYAPTDYDFDLEKQFGVKPLPRAGLGRTAAIAALARKRSRWLYAAAGVFAVATVGLILYRRRRRAAASAG